MADSSILLPISLGLNYQHHHQDIYGILELFPFPESNTGEAKGASAEGEESSKASPVAHYQLQNALCLIDIPDLFLPKDILQYFQYLLPSILSFRIFHHYFPNTQQYILVLIFPSQLSCQRFADQYENKMISSVYDIHCRFYCIQSLSLQTYYEHIPIVSSHQLNTLFSPHQIVEAKELLSTVANGISRSSPKTLGSTSRERSGTLASVGPRSRSNTPMNLPIPLSDSLPSLNLTISVSPHQLQRKTSHDYRHNQETCPLCLEPISNEFPNIMILYCCHSFHVNCLMRIEGVQCPVCRYEHNNLKAHATSCFLCGFPYQSSTPQISSVYPLNKSIDSLDSQTLHALSSETQRQAVAPQEDVWLCLVCGFTGCGYSHGNHIEDHYRDTLHTYAMNISHPNKVWDFAGNGYVHRLILQRSDEAEEAEEETVGRVSSLTSRLLTSDLVDASHQLPRTKVTEVSDPRPISGPTSATTMLEEEYGRRTLPPLDDEMQEQLVNEKMNKLLAQYQEVFVWRMTQNRLFYEEKLKQIWDSVAVSGAPPTISDSAVPSLASETRPPLRRELPLESSDSLSWTKNIRMSLVQEHQRLVRQCDQMRERIQNLTREGEVSRELHKHLVLNRKEWEERLVRAKERLAQTEKNYEEEVPKLQEKVNQLMLRLDQMSKQIPTEEGKGSKVVAALESKAERDVGSDPSSLSVNPMSPCDSRSKRDGDSSSSVGNRKKKS